MASIFIISLLELEMGVLFSVKKKQIMVKHNTRMTKPSAIKGVIVCGLFNPTAQKSGGILNISTC